MDSDLNAFKIQIYEVSIILGNKESQLKLNGLKEKMLLIRDKSKIIAEMVMFCLGNQRKMETIINAYCQLVHKKHQLHKEMEKLAVNLLLRRPQLEAEHQAKIVKTFNTTDTLINDLWEAESTPF